MADLHSVKTSKLSSLPIGCAFSFVACSGKFSFGNKLVRFMFWNCDNLRQHIKPVHFPGSFSPSVLFTANSSGILPVKELLAGFNCE